ncbi:MAG: TetR/AcrR family transcriptional regulator [Ruminococcaceae bacterium]|nr:TetR/AcrR family transcriptional regulator [Oscillospiraceae bacterium]
MARRRVNTTKYEIIQVATRLFLTNGYSATAPKHVCEELDISTGNLTYYFPTKEHLLVVLVKMLCTFQREAVEKTEESGQTSLFAICMEMATMAAMCEESEIAKDLFLSAYSSPMCLDYIRKNDNERAKLIYGEYCPDWDDARYAEAEVLVSGIEYATMMTTGDPVPLEERIRGAVNNIMRIYNVPEEVRERKIRKVLKLDYRTLSRRVLEGFRQFVDQVNRHAFEELLGKDDE